MTGFPVSWALLARLRSDPASKNLKSFLLPYGRELRTLPALRFKTCRQKGNQSESRKKKLK